MSGVARPRGPLPARVYWTRRALVLGVAFLLVFTLAKLLGGGSDGRASQDERATQVAGYPRTTAGATPTSTITRKSGKNAKKTKAPLAHPDGPCDPEDITVTPTVEDAIAGSPVRFVFELTGKEAACTWTVSATSMVVRITSGKDNIWSSQHCPKAVPTRGVVVRSAVVRRVAVEWPGWRSDEDCKITAWALPGWYHVTSAAFGAEPTDEQFELDRPRAKRVTEAPKPKPGSKAKAGTSTASSEKPSP